MGSGTTPPLPIRRCPGEVLNGKSGEFRKLILTIKLPISKRSTRRRFMVKIPWSLRQVVLMDHTAEPRYSLTYVS